MIFNFYLANHHEYSLNSLADMVMPIAHGMEEAGHHAIAFGLGMREAPAVNILLEFFEDDAFTEQLLSMKDNMGERFIFGVLCTEDIEDDLVMSPADHPRRRANLMRVLPRADFVWTLLPQMDLYRRICGADRVALLEYGYAERFVERDIITEPGLRDVDAILYGNENDHRRPVATALRDAGFTCFVSSREQFPNYVTNDVIRRAKVLIDLRRGPGVRFLSPTRINRGLHSGTAVVSEQFDTSEIAGLYRFTEARPYAEIAARCIEIIRGRRYVELGSAALVRYRDETSMRRSVEQAMTLPLFRRLAGAGA